MMKKECDEKGNLSSFFCECCNTKISRDTYNARAHVLGQKKTIDSDSTESQKLVQLFRNSFETKFRSVLSLDPVPKTPTELYEEMKELANNFRNENPFQVKYSSMMSSTVAICEKINTYNKQAQIRTRLH